MGIFTVPLSTLQNTRIYVSATDEIPDRQLTLYTNHIGTRHDGGFMILPVPYPSSVRFHTPQTLRASEEYFHFLDKVDQAFDDFERYRQSVRHRDPHGPRLAAYQVEVIDSIEDLIEFNNREHILHGTTMDELAELYSARHWGFILCKIHEGEYLYEPLCYSHRTLREQLYVPSLTYNPRGFNDVHIRNQYDRFDDTYYINGALVETDDHYYDHRVREVNPQKISSIPWNYLPNGFQKCLRMFLKMRLVGSHPNIDHEFPINYLLYSHSRSNNRRNIDWLDENQSLPF